MTSAVTKGRRSTLADSENGISPVDDRMPAPKMRVSPASSMRPNSMENQLRRFSASTWSPDTARAAARPMVVSSPA